MNRTLLTVVSVLGFASVAGAGPVGLEPVKTQVVNDETNAIPVSVVEAVEVEVIGSRLGPTFFQSALDENLGTSSGVIVKLQFNLPSDKAVAVKRVFASTQTYNATFPGALELQRTYLEITDITDTRIALIGMPQSVESNFGDLINYAADMDLPWQFNSGESINLRVSAKGTTSITASISVVGELIDK
jgi:hypothetical protein